MTLNLEQFCSLFLFKCFLGSQSSAEGGIHLFTANILPFVEDFGGVGNSLPPYSVYPVTGWPINSVHICWECRVSKYSNYKNFFEMFIRAIEFVHNGRDDNSLSHFAGSREAVAGGVH